MKKEPDDEETTRFPKWHILRELPEFYALIIAFLALMVLIGEAIYIHFIRDGILLRHVWAIIGVHITGGAALGVIQAAKYPYMLVRDNVSLNGTFAVFLIFLFGSLFNLSCRGLFHAPWLKDLFSRVKSGARNQKKTWIKFGIPGVFIFVLFPLTGTGPIVGFVLGKLMGLGFWTNLLTVASASLTTVVSFAFLGDKLSDKLGDKVLNRVVLTVIALLILSAVFAKLVAWFRNRKGCGHAAIATDDAIIPRDNSDSDFLDEEEKLEKSNRNSFS